MYPGCLFGLQVGIQLVGFQQIPAEMCSAGLKYWAVAPLMQLAVNLRAVTMGQMSARSEPCRQDLNQSHHRCANPYRPTSHNSHKNKSIVGNLRRTPQMYQKLPVQLLVTLKAQHDRSISLCMGVVMQPYP